MWHTWLHLEKVASTSVDTSDHCPCKSQDQSSLKTQNATVQRQSSLPQPKNFVHQNILQNGHLSSLTKPASCLEEKEHFQLVKKKRGLHQQKSKKGCLIGGKGGSCNPSPSASRQV